jgi:hypothetical protein
MRMLGPSLWVQREWRLSDRYQEIILPDVEHFRHRPSPRQLAAVLDCLAANAWCQSKPTDDIYLSVSDAKAAAGAAPAGVVLAYLQGGASDSSPDDWPSEEPLFSPGLCEDVLLLSSPTLILLPGDMNGGSLFCAACDQDIRPALRRQEDRAYEADAGPEFQLVRKGFLLAPVTCPSCGVGLQHEELVLALEGVEDEAPFCHFAVRLQALHAPTVDLVYPDPEFLEQLSQACGVPLRSTGRLG